MYKRLSPQKNTVQAADVLQKGNEQLAAGYILYGTSTMLAYTVGHSVHAFTYEPSMGEFLLAYQAMQMPKDDQSYAINDGYFAAFPSYVQRYIQQCRRNSYATPYIGALIADFHRHLNQSRYLPISPYSQEPRRQA